MSSEDYIKSLEADFQNHHIEGYARAAMGQGYNGKFKAPLVSHVEGNLWQGGCYDGVFLPRDFKYVVSLYPWEKYKLPRETARLEFKLYDSADMPEAAELYNIARIINAFCDSGQTLVHCQAGLNRSGLLAGLALVLKGYTPEDAIAKLRESRSPVVLCNQTFENWLLNQNG